MSSLKFVSKLGRFHLELQLKSKPLIVLCVQTKLKERLVLDTLFIHSFIRLVVLLILQPFRERLSHKTVRDNAERYYGQWGFMVFD